MDPEEKKQLDEVLKISRENNALLRSIISRARWGTAFRLFYWIMIIGLSVGAFYFIQPYVNAVSGDIGQFKNSLDTFRSLVK